MILEYRIQNYNIYFNTLSKFRCNINFIVLTTHQIFIMIALYILIASCTNMKLVIAQSCSIIEQTPTVYLVSGQPYAQDLFEIFTGTNLVFSDNATINTTFIQTLTYQNMTLSAPLPVTSSVVQIVLNNYPQKSLSQYNLAALVSAGGQYYVYLAQEQTSTASILGWTQAGLPIQGGANLMCNGLVFIFGFYQNQKVVVSCIYNQTQQIFYIIDPSETENQPPLLEQPGIVLPSSNQSLIAFQSAYTSNSTNVLSLVYSNSSSGVAYIMQVSDTEGLATNFSLISSLNTNTSITGFQLIDEAAQIVLTPKNLIVYNQGTQQKLPLSDTVSAVAMGAFVLSYNQNYYELTLSVSFYASNYTQTNYTQTNYTQNYILFVKEGLVYLFNTVGPEIPYPSNFQQPITSIQVSEAYVLVISTTTVLLVPGYLQNTITVPISEWNLTNFPYVWLLNTYTQTIYLIAPSISTQTNIQLCKPYMLLSSNKLGYGQFQLTATTSSGQCFVMFNYLVSEPNQVVNTTAAIPNETMLQGSPAQIILNFYFLGANLQYEAVATNQANNQTQNIPILQTQITNPPVQVTGGIIFSQIVPYNFIDDKVPDPKQSYFYFVQTQAEPQLLQAWFCGKYACSDGNMSRPQTLFVNGSISEIALSRLLNSTINFLAISFQNSSQVAILNVLSNERIIPSPDMIDIGQVLPNAVVSQITIISNFIYIVTSSPSVLLIYSLYDLAQPTTYAFQNSINPRQIFTSVNYANLIFVDNVSELLVLAVNAWNTSLIIEIIQKINYQITQGQSYVGVGLLDSGFYVAETNSTNQYLTFYPRQAVDAFYPYSYEELSVAMNLTYFGLTIVTPLVSAFSSFNFYLQVKLNSLNQIAIFQGIEQPLNMFYKAQPIPVVKTISLATVLYRQEAFDAYDLLDINYSQMFLQATANAIGIFDPSISMNNENYTLSFTATSTNGTITLYSVLMVYLSYLDIKPALYGFGSEELPDKPFPGWYHINPAHYFYGMIRDYRVQIVNVNRSQVLTTQPAEVIQPIYNVPQVINTQLSNYTATSSNSSYQLLLVNQTGMYQLQQVNNVSNYLTSSLSFDSVTKYNLSNLTGCPLAFYYNTTMPVVLCQNSSQSFLYYIFGLQNLVNLTANPNLTNIVSAQYNNQFQLLAIQTLSQLALFPIKFNSTSNYFYTSQVGFQIENAQMIANYSIITFESQNRSSLYFYGLITVLQDGSTINLQGYMNSVFINHTIEISPSLDWINQKDNSKIISIQQFGSGVASQSFGAINMRLVVLTQKQAYLFAITLQNSNPSKNITAIYQITFNSFDNLPTQSLLVIDTNIVTTYFNQTDNTTILGLYQPPFDAEVVRSLGFYAFQTFPFPINSLQLSPKGALTFQNSTGSFYQLQIFQYVSIYFDLALISKNLGQTINTQYALQLIANSTYKQTTQNFTGEVQIKIQYEPKIESAFEAKMITGGLFALIIFTTLFFLFYKSCKKPQFNEEY